MSEVTLAERYAPENFSGPIANLAKRFQSNSDEESIHYSEVGFGDVSEEQAKVTLKYFSEIGLIENPKRGKYTPPESVISWQRKLPPANEEAKQEVIETLREYDVFKETLFLLEQDDHKLAELAKQVGGLVGIDEEELTDLERTIEVFEELGFVKIGSDNVVAIPDETTRGSVADEESSQASEKAEESNNGASISESTPDIPSKAKPASDGSGINTLNGLQSDLNITLDATEMDSEELREKLEIIKEATSHDGE